MHANCFIWIEIYQHSIFVQFEKYKKEKMGWWQPISERKQLFTCSHALVVSFKSVSEHLKLLKLRRHIIFRVSRWFMLTSYEISKYSWNNPWMFNAIWDQSVCYFHDRIWCQTYVLSGIWIVRCMNAPMTNHPPDWGTHTHINHS